MGSRYATSTISGRYMLPTKLFTTQIVPICDVKVNAASVLILVDTGCDAIRSAGQAVANSDFEK